MRKSGLTLMLLLAAGVAPGSPNRAAFARAEVEAPAQQNVVPLGARLKIKWQGDVVRFQEGSASHEVAIRDQFHAARLEKVTLQSAKEAGGFIYVLLDVTGPSKIPQDNHQCGAGYESDLIWLKLDGDWKLKDAKNFRYESCWATIDPDEPPKWQGDTISVTVFSVSAGTSKTLTATYSYKRPEEGLKVVEVATK
jgi:hypothetical protein